MTYNQMVNSTAAYGLNPNLDNPNKDIPTIKAGRENSLDSKTIRDINKNFKKYKRIEGKTGVPWKVLAAIDRATNYPVGIVAKKVQKYAKELNRELNPDSDAREVMDLISVLKKEHPSKAQLFDAFLSYFQRIDAAYTNS